jgi:hypothetical protein
MHRGLLRRDRVGGGERPTLFEANKPVPVLRHRWDLLFECDQSKLK